MGRNHFDSCILSFEGSALKTHCWTIRNGSLGWTRMSQESLFCKVVIHVSSKRSPFYPGLRSYLSPWQLATPRGGKNPHQNITNFFSNLDLFYLSLKVSFTLIIMVQLCHWCWTVTLALSVSRSVKEVNTDLPPKVQWQLSLSLPGKNLYQNTHPRYLVASASHRWASNVVWLLIIYPTCSQHSMC